MAAIAAGILAATATASGIKREHADVTLKMGYVTGRAHPYGLAMSQYERRVEAASGGRVDIQLTPVYAGGDDVALLNDIAGGTQDGGAVSIAVLPGANINNLIPLQLPFLVDSYELEQRLIVNSSGIAQQMLRGIERNAKLVPVGLFEGGMRHFVLKNKYVDSLAALKGVKIRAVPSSHLVDTSGLWERSLKRSPWVTWPPPSGAGLSRVPRRTRAWSRRSAGTPPARTGSAW
jgi:TRAP-type C4-dicarboxylate transport system substrate-binding protein